jgi:hypothetical protein
VRIPHATPGDLDVDHAVAGTGVVRHGRLAPIWFAAG